MTPAELEESIEAYQWRDNQQWRRTAWQTAYLINIWQDKDHQVTVDDLLQQHKPKEPQTVVQQVSVMEMWVAALGGIDKRQKGVH